MWMIIYSFALILIQRLEIFLSLNIIIAIHIKYNILMQQGDIAMLH